MEDDSFVDALCEAPENFTFGVYPVSCRLTILPIWNIGNGGLRHDVNRLLPHVRHDADASTAEMAYNGY